MLLIYSPNVSPVAEEISSSLTFYYVVRESFNKLILLMFDTNNTVCGASSVAKMLNLNWVNFEKFWMQIFWMDKV